MRGNYEIKEVWRGRALALGGPTRFSNEFPLGEGWVAMLLRFNHVVTIGTGAGVIAESGLRVIRGVQFKTDKGDFPINNSPARWLYYLDRMKSKTPALLDSVAAGSATYRTLLRVHFLDPLALRPEDTIFNSGRYSSVELTINYGTIADLYSAPGTATVAPTCDCYIVRQKGPLPTEVVPKVVREYGVRVPVDPSAVQEIILERAGNLGYQRLAVFAANGATVVAGQPFSGDAGDGILSDVTVEHDQGRPFDQVPFAVLQEHNKQELSLEARQAGLAVMDFSGDGSINSALYSGDKSRLSVRWTNGVVGATPQVSVGYEAIRPLVP